MEYNNTPQGARHLSGDGYGTSPGATAALGYSTTPSRQPHRSRDHYDTPPRQVDGTAYDFQDAPAHYSQSDRHELHMGDRHLPSLDVAQPPPPPPAHRSRHSSIGQESPQVSPTKAGPSTPMRRDVLRSEAQRYTTSTSSARQSYSHHDLPPSPHSPASHGSPHTTRSLHATVEDAPDSPTGPGTSSYRSRHDSEPLTAPMGRSRHDSEPPTSSMTSSYRSRHDSEPPVPLNPSHRGMHDGEPSFERDPSPNPYQRHSTQPSPGYPNQAPRYVSSHEDYDDQDYDRGYQGSPIAMPGHGYGGSPHSTPQHHHVRQSSGQPLRAPTYALPAPPASLQHTVDPRLAREVSERINEERQYDSRLASQHGSAARGRQRSEPPPSYGLPSQTYVPPTHHDRHPSSVTYSGGPQDVQSVQLRGYRGNMSASPAHSIPRKSVSPAPQAHEGQHASDVPFGPDSYDALNPSMVSSRSSNSALSGQDHKDHNGKIVMHDGREVDPSDHLPMESWAPEPEPKLGRNSASADNLRRSPVGAQPMPPTGRRQMRLSRAETAPITSYGHDEPHTPPAPTGGRTRLQKKPPRGASVSPGAPSPLAPSHTENHQERQSPYGSYGRQGLAHRGSYDYPSENYSPLQYGSGPPIPAKIPLMSGANNGSELSLAEEMQRIDIGNGRSRRRGGY
ncbi:C2 calcium lipid-binding [Cordyceps militaris]|uniref:C2 calcium lipid-binding n=1 Tax=Cordyceps militaris TaxID=73501 RepID=A0A2H4SEI7_CORMI|nr:C2 calcium lipid-binding [Cordyceps militaris]